MESNLINEQLPRRGFLRGAVLLGGAAALAGCGFSDGDPQATPLPPSSPPSPSRGTSSAEAAPRTGEFAAKPTWEQDFTRMKTGMVDPNAWRPELNPAVPTYNEEAQGYTDRTSNVRIQNGVLVLEAHREPFTYGRDPQNIPYKYTSGRIDTRESLTFAYGKIEARMKMPKGKGTWPAFWLLSANQVHTDKLHPTDADWAKEGFYAKDGELDIVEAYGRDPGAIEATVHTYNGVVRKEYDDKEKRLVVPNASGAFHTYGVELTPTKIVWTLDGKPYFAFKKPSNNPNDWPFKGGNEFYAILNLAMGGNGGGPIDPDLKSARLEVEHVRFYEYTGN